MDRVFRWSLVLVLVLALLPACGGGGGSSPSAGSSTDTVINGTASKGIIANGLVKVYAVNADGTKGELLKQTTTDEQGRFTANLGTYTGPILVEASGGYADEATGLPATIDEATPLRTCVADVQGEVSVAVTPLTELAVQQAIASGLTAEAMATANNLVSGLFGCDILATRPVPPEAAAMASATEDEKNYTLALAALSQMAEDAGQPMTELLDSMADELVGADKLAWDTVEDFDNALASFLDNPNNHTGIADNADTGLGSAARRRALVRLGFGNLPEGTLIGGLEVTLALPEGGRVAAAGAGEPAEGVVTATGVAAAGSMIEAYFAPETPAELASLDIALINAEGLGAGEFAEVRCEFAGSTLPDDSAFDLLDTVAYDGFGATIPGVTVTLIVEAAPEN